MVSHTEHKSSRSNNIRAAKGILIIVGCIILASCATSPLPPNSRPVQHTKCEREDTQMSCKPGTVDYSLAYIDNTYEGYRDKLIEELKLDNRMSNSVIGVGALIAGFGLFEAHVDTIKAAALAGGTTLSFGKFNVIPTRQDVYLEGMLAMHCAKKTVAPLVHLSKNPNVLKEQEAALLEALNEAANALGNLLAAGSLNNLQTNPKILSLAEQSTSDLQNGIKTALEQLNKFSQLQTKSHSLGPILEAKVDNIRQVIDKAIHTETKQLDDVREHLKNLNDYVQVFAPGLDINQSINAVLGTLSETSDSSQEAKVTAEGKSNGSLQASLKTPVLYLAQTIGEANAALVKLNAILATLDLSIDSLFATALEENEACGLKPTETQPQLASLTLSGSSITISHNEAETKNIPISGGKPNYIAEFLDVPEAGLTAVPDSRSMLKITSNGELKAGKVYKLQIKDSSEPAQVVTFTIKTSSEARAKSMCTNHKPLNSKEIESLQRRLDLDGIDGIYNAAICHALVKKLKKIGDVSFPINVAAAHAFLAGFQQNTISSSNITDGNIGCTGSRAEKNQYECFLENKDIEILRESLRCYAADTDRLLNGLATFDAPLRKAIQTANKSSKSITTDNDEVTGELVSELKGALKCQ